MAEDTMLPEVTVSGRRPRFFNTIGVGLSSSAGKALGAAPTAAIPTYTLADQSEPGLPPGTVIDAATRVTTFINRYPDETPPYYFSINIMDYKRTNWLQMAETPTVANIALPMPQKIIDNHRVEYDFLDLQETGLIGNEIFNQMRSGFDAKGMAGAAGGLITGGAANATGRAGVAVPQAIGYAINNFLTVMLKGPAYKRRDFQWHFSPKTPQESQHLRDIISLLNQSMAPSLPATLGSAFFGWPRIFRPSFNYADPKPMKAYGSDDLGDWIYHMKPSVLIDLTADYTPQSVWSAYAQTKAPESIDLHLGFLELEFWLKESNWGPGRRGLAQFEPSKTPAAAPPTTASQVNANRDAARAARRGR